jgi:hypothetical protein
VHLRHLAPHGRSAMQDMSCILTTTKTLPPCVAQRSRFVDCRLLYCLPAGPLGPTAAQCIHTVVPAQCWQRAVEGTKLMHKDHANRIQTSQL